jgi:putative membrane protein
VEATPFAVEPRWAELVAVLFLGGWYLREQRLRPAGAWRQAAFAAGLVLLVLAFATPVDTLARRYLLSAHLVQNVLLAEWVPLLLVAGLGSLTAAALARRRVVRLLTRPVVALPVWVGTYIAWHVPAAYEAALRHPETLLPVEHLSYLVAGVLLWWPLVHYEPWVGRSGAKAAYVFAAFLLASPIGLALALLPSALYGFYEAAPRVWGMSPLLDQQIAGILMSLAEAIVFFAAFAVLFLRFLREEEQRESDRVAGNIKI